MSRQFKEWFFFYNLFVDFGVVLTWVGENWLRQGVLLFSTCL